MRSLRTEQDSTGTVLLVALCAHPYLRDAPPAPLPLPAPLLLLRTSLVRRTSKLLLLVQSATAARARVAGVVEGAAGVVVGAAVAVVEAVEVVAVVGLVAGVGALLAAMELVAVGLELGLEVLEVASGSSSSIGARPSHPSSFKSGCFSVGRLGTCGRFHTQHRWFSRLDDAWRAEFGDEVERPHWADLLRSDVAIFDLDFDDILSAMYALSVSAEGDCYRCVPPDRAIAAVALGASEFGTLPGTAPAEALHTFTLDSGASRFFFRDSTTLTPLPAPIPVQLADPSGDSIVARSSTVLPCRSILLMTTRVRLQLRERFRADLRVLRLHSNRVGEFSSDLLRDFCRGEGILQSFTLPDSPQQKGIAERRIGVVMEVARTSMIHAAAPHFLWSFAVQYATHQLILWPRVSFPETSPTLCWTGKVGDASGFWVWGSRAFVRDTSANKLSACAIPCVFLGFVPNSHGWKFKHPSSRCVLPSQDVTFDESVPFYHLFPYRSAPLPPPLLFLAPVDPLPPQGPAPTGVSQVHPPPGAVPGELAVNSSAARGTVSGGAETGGAETGGAKPRGAESGGAERGGAETGGTEPGGVEPEGVEPGGAELEGAESRGVVPQGAALSGVSGGASPRLSPQQLREWLVRRARLRSGATGAGGAGAAGSGGAGVTARAGVSGGTTATGPGGAGTRVTGATGTSGVRGAGARDLAGSRAAGAGGSGAERCETASRPVFPVRSARRVPRSRPPPVSGTHTMALRPSYVPQHVPLPAPSESSLPEVPDPESDRACAASSTVSRLLACAVTDTSFECAAASGLVAELLDFAAACRLDYATTLVAVSTSASPPFVGGECALGTDVLEDKQEDFECLAAAVPRFASMMLAPEGDPDAPNIPTLRSYVEAITGPYSSQWQAAMDAEMAS
ncbi:unnamed protein product [Closterium sp. NIES-54]